MGNSSLGFQQNKASILQLIDDPLVHFTYLLAISSASFYFNELTNLGSENEVIEHKIVGDFGEVVQKIPGKLNYYSLNLSRGLTSDTDLAIWRKLVEDGNIEEARVDATLTVFDIDSTPVAEWDLFECWPSALEIIHNAEGIPMEQVTIAMDGLQRTS